MAAVYYHWAAFSPDLACASFLPRGLRYGNNLSSASPILLPHWQARRALQRGCRLHIDRIRPHFLFASLCTVRRVFVFRQQAAFSCWHLRLFPSSSLCAFFCFTHIDRHRHISCVRACLLLLKLFTAPEYIYTSLSFSSFNPSSLKALV